MYVRRRLYPGRHAVRATTPRVVGGTIGHGPRYPIEGCKRDTRVLLQVLYHVGDPERNDLVQKHKVFRRRMPAALLPIASDPGGN